METFNQEEQLSDGDQIDRAKEKMEPEEEQQTIEEEMLTETDKEREKEIEEKGDETLEAEKKNWKKKYEDAKAEIKTPDEVLINQVKKEGYAFQDTAQEMVIASLIESEKKLKKYLKDKPLFDIGCGEFGWCNASAIGGISPQSSRDFGFEDYTLNLGVHEIVLVDPYANFNNVPSSVKKTSDWKIAREEEKISTEKINLKLKEAGWPKERWVSFPPTHDIQRYFQKTDGLSFLNEQEDESGNNLTANIDYLLIPHDNYLKRIAQEIFRVTPENGIFMSMNSPEIENEARKLFPIHKEIGYGMEVFMKK